MQVVFYFTKKKRNSTKSPTGASKAYECILKEASTIIRPTIMIKWDGSGAPLYNYAHIEVYDRFYWVNNWTYENRCWVAQLEVDVLTTFKGSIGNSTKYILRAASDQNNDIVDVKFPPKFPLHTQKFPLPMNWAQTFSAGDYVVSVVGNNQSFSVAGTSYYELVPANVDALLSSVFTETEDMWSAPLAGSDLETTLADYGLKFFKSIANPGQFINSIYWVPFKINPGTGPQMIKLGDLQTTAAGIPISDPIVTKTFEFRVPGAGDYPAELDVLPFTTWQLFMPPFGVFELDGRIIRQFRGVDGKIMIDVTNGEAIMEVSPAGEGTTPILIAQGKIGTSIALSGMDINYAGLEKTSLLTAGNVTKSIMSLDVAGAITGLGAGIIDAAQAGAPTATNGGYGGGLAALRGFCGVVATYFDRVEADWEEQGHPIMEKRMINEFEGYILCAEGDVEAYGTEEELNKINAFLTGGFFYE